MPHIVVEYSANIRDRIDLPGLIDALGASRSPIAFFSTQPRPTHGSLTVIRQRASSDAARRSAPGAERGCRQCAAVAVFIAMRAFALFPTMSSLLACRLRAART
ncbi:MAG: hypothetical protein KF786_05395 [Burkholderiaceae bacterium]|nr:hypothetical protein [Burkholderiaceae bacterium]